jgi:hypothetical protein
VTLLAPGFLWASLVLAAGIVALHFIVRRQPPATVLPTARFVPDSPATAIVRDARPVDLLLMLLRVLIVLAVGSALAKPVFEQKRQATGRVFVVDASRATSNFREAADSVRALFREGDAIVLFDSAARALGPAAPESLSTVHASTTSGNLSAGLTAAVRAGSALRDRVDSVELVLVSPLLAEERDAATDSIRKLWPGRARLIHIRPATSDSSLSVAKGDITIDTDQTDPLAITVSMAAKRPFQGNARILRSGKLTAADSAWMGTDNHVLALWPTSGRPLFAEERGPADQSGGIVGRDLRLVSTFDRRWKYPPDSLRDARVIARWADGEPAVIEKRVGNGCLKSVGIPVTDVGDLVIRPEFQRLVEVVTAPCGDLVAATPLAASGVASLGGAGHLAPRDAFIPRDNIPSPLAPRLFGLALIAALAELVVRSRSAG